MIGAGAITSRWESFGDKGSDSGTVVKKVVIIGRHEFAASDATVRDAA